MNKKIEMQISNTISDGMFHNITFLTKKLKIPRTTLMRTLNEMEAKSEVELSWGNVRKSSKSENENITHKKMALHAANKNRIAKMAAQQINDGDLIYIDSGSTTAHLLEHIKNKNIVIYTNNLFLFQNIPKEFKPIIYIVPGELYQKTHTIIGSLVINFLKNVYIDKAFLGVNDVRGTKLFTSNQEEAILKNEIIRHAQQTFVLYDKSKKDANVGKYLFGDIGGNVKEITE